MEYIYSVESYEEVCKIFKDCINCPLDKQYNIPANCSDLILYYPEEVDKIISQYMND